jgi:hypothetical protein
MTHIDLVRYLKAMRLAVSQPNVLKNYSDLDLWFEVDGEIKILHPGEILS